MQEMLTGKSATWNLSWWSPSRRLQLLNKMWVAEMSRWKPQQSEIAELFIVADAANRILQSFHDLFIYLSPQIIRLEGQVTRYKTASEAAEKVEDELKVEKRKLQREVLCGKRAHWPSINPLLICQHSTLVMRRQFTIMCTVRWLSQSCVKDRRHIFPLGILWTQYYASKPAWP